MTKKKLIFLPIGYPDTAHTSGMYSDLMAEFKLNGYDVTVVAPSETHRYYGMGEESGIRVIRLKALNQFSSNPILKGIANLLLPYQYKRALRKYGLVQNYDLILMPTPPITMISVVKWLKQKSGAKFYLILRDIFPQNAVDLKMLSEKSPVYHYFRRMEKKCYRIADAIGCMSPANIDYIVKHNPEADIRKLHLLPNWLRLPEGKPDNGKAIPGELQFLKEKFVLLYGGNMGKPQQAESILNLAKMVQNDPEIHFFFVGKGTEKSYLENYATQHKITNVSFSVHLPMQEYSNLLQHTDIGLISLNKDFTIPNFPSKSLAYFSVGIPVLAALDKNTDFGSFLDNINAGFWSLTDDTQGLKEQLYKLKDHPELRKEMGQNGLQYLQANLLPEHAYLSITRHLEQSVGNAKKPFSRENQSKLT